MTTPVAADDLEVACTEVVMRRRKCQMKWSAAQELI